MDALVNAIVYIGALLFLGAGLFWRWIGPEVTSHAVRRRLRAGSWAGAILVLAGSALAVASALTRAVGAFDLSLVPTYLSQTRHGNAVLARIAIVLILLMIEMTARRRRLADRIAFPGLGLGLLATFSLTSHAGAMEAVLPVVADLGHLVGAVVWGGALIYLAWLPIWPSPGHPGFLIVPAAQRVSRAGAVGLSVLILTGVYAAILHIWGLAALTRTPYGLTLLYKVGLVIVILAVAAVNWWVLIPRLSQQRSASQQRSIAALGRLVRIESLLVIGVLGLTGLLTSRPLPEPPARLVGVTSFKETIGAWTLRGSLSPRQPDGLSLELSINDAAGNPPPQSLDMQIVMTMQDHPMPPVEVRPVPTGPGSYRATVSLPMAGRWELAISLPEGTVRVPVQAKVGSAPAPRIAWPQLVPGLLGMLAAAVLVLFGTRRIGVHTRQGRIVAGIGAALAIAGVILIVRSQVPGAYAVSILDRPNPIPSTPESRAVGERIYRAQCQVCHGVTGSGDGPAALALRPRPADLRVHMAAGHTDGQLFDWISNGFPGTAMPAFKSTLSEQERWDAINFIRTFAFTDR